MGDGITFVELCAGSAAVSLRLLGGEYAKSPAPYQGSKLAYAASLLNIMGLQPGQQIEHLVLVEPGPWAAVWQVMSQGGAGDMITAMEPWCAPDNAVQRATFDRLRAELRAGLLHDPVVEGAAWLWLLQRSMMCTGSSGYIGVAAKGVKAAHPIPKILALAGLKWPRTTVHRCSAVDVEPIPGAIVYMDPPYKGTSSYRDGFPPDQVRAVAEAWHAAGASVCVSEDRRVVPRWPVRAVKRQSMHHFAGRRTEFVTCSPPRSPDA